MANKTQLPEEELYCIAKILQSIIFSPNRSIFYACNYCKLQKKCMPDNIPHPDMFFDRLRKDLQQITGVDLDILVKADKFQDNITNG